MISIEGVSEKSSLELKYQQKFIAIETFKHYVLYLEKSKIRGHKIDGSVNHTMFVAAAPEGNLLRSLHITSNTGRIFATTLKQTLLCINRTFLDRMQEEVTLYPEKSLLQWKVKQVGTGFDHTLVLTTSGGVYGIGRNKEKQILPLEDNEYYEVPARIKFFDSSKVKVIAAGGNSSACSLISKNAKYFDDLADQQENTWTTLSWGKKLYHIEETNSFGFRAQNSLINKQISCLSMGISHVIATIHPIGTVYSWGDNTYGQLGVGTNFSYKQATKIYGISNIKKVIAGDYSTFLFTDTHKIICCGLMLYRENKHFVQLKFSPLSFTTGEDMKISNILHPLKYTLIAEEKITIPPEQKPGWFDLARLEEEFSIKLSNRKKTAICTKNRPANEVSSLLCGPVSRKGVLEWQLKFIVPGRKQANFLRSDVSIGIAQLQESFLVETYSASDLIFQYLLHQLYKVGWNKGVIWILERVG
eukprot:maker-scaffold_43-snap-gene-1.27-mRNA-1 protein AED:0.50 eAED:0.53 QI:0/0/0/1/1/1/3/0/472